MSNGLRISLARNKTSANRLDIIYDGGADLYNMRFYRKTFSKKTFESKPKDIETHEGIYCDMLEEMPKFQSVIQFTKTSFNHESNQTEWKNHLAE